MGNSIMRDFLFLSLDDFGQHAMINGYEQGLLVLFNASDIVASEISFPSDEVIYLFLIYFVSSLYKGMKVKGHPGRA